MAKANYIKLEEAAEKLGVSADKLKAMIDNNEVRAFRDGASFKFKSDELDRIQATIGDLAPSVPDSVTSDVDDSLDELVSVDGILDDDDSADSLLVEENAGGNATVIGEAGAVAGDSDLTLVGDSDLNIDTPDLQISTGDSDVLGGDPELSLSGSDTGILSKEDPGLEIGDGSDAFELVDEKPAGSGSDLEISGGSDLDISGGSDLNLGGSKDLDMSGDSDLSLGVGSDLDLAGGSDAIDLDDADLVVGGSDVTLGGGDSGINLSNPADSGLSLESAMGSDPAMQLDDDDMLSLDGDDLDQAPELKADDDFLLTPVEEDSADDSDSGSQVIALDSEEFDDSAATLLDGDAGGFGDALVEDVSDVGFEEATVAATPTPASLSTAKTTETDFSLANVLSLACLLVLMLMGSVMMLDVMKNIWSWDGAVGVSSPLMESLAGLLGN